MFPNMRLKNNKRKQPNDPAVQVLKDIKESLLQSQNSSEPLVKDVEIPRIRREKVFTMVSSVSSYFQTSTSLEVDTEFVFNVNSLINSSAFSALFDQFRLIGIKIMFFPAFVAGGGYPPSFPIYSAIDYDDTNSTAISALLQYDTLKVANSECYWERSLIPRAALAVYGGSTFTNYGTASPAQWIDAGSINTPYYGLKVGTAATNGTCTINYVVQYTMQFRNLR